MLNTAPNGKFQDDGSTFGSVTFTNNPPMSYEELLQTIPGHFLEAMKKASSEPCLFIKVKYNTYHKVKVENIYYIEALADYMKIYTGDKTFIIHSTMRNILNNMPKSEFARVHRSYIVRIDLISKIVDNMVVIKDKLIPISPKYKKELFSNLNVL